MEEKSKQTNNFYLVNWDNAPLFMRINPFVIEGYRPYFSYFLCLKSLFRLHNETFNIWTHIISTIIFIYLMIISQDWFWHNNLIDIFFINIYGSSCIILFTISSCYHLFSCHSHKSMIFFARLDFAGISIGIICSVLPGIYSSLSCYPILKWINICIVSIFLIASSILLLVPKYSYPEYKTCLYNNIINNLIRYKVIINNIITKVRNTIYTIMGFYSFVPFGLWIHLKGWNSEEVQIYFWKMSIAYGLFILGALVYITRIPERFYPSKLTSIWLQSHIFWHLFVSSGSFWLFKTGWDYYEYSQGGTNC